MANIPQTTYSNIPAYPKSWYQASGNWVAKTVSVAADRYKLTSPTAMQIDVGNLSLTSTVSQEIDLSVATNWGVNVTTRQNDTSYSVGDVIPTPTTSAHYWECTTAGVSASSDPGSWGIAIGDTKADGSTLVWTSRYLNPSSANELMLLDVAPGGSGWSTGNTLTGATSGAVCTVVTVLSTTAYIVSGRTRSYTAGEIISNGTDAADQGATYPTLSGRAGQDFYIYACVGTSITPVIKVSPNSTYPWGYNATTSRKIGGFHCLCASAGTISSHPASGYLTGDIIPNSVWCLNHKSASGSNVGLAYIDKIQEWWAIYPLSGTLGAPTNVYGGTHLVSVDWNTCVDAAKVINMKLPGDADFQVSASGSNEKTNILGSVDSVTVGGHVDTAGRRMISKYFLEDCCGLIYQWLDEQAMRWDFTTSWNWYDLPGGKGSLFNGAGAAGTGDVKLAAGGSWNYGGNCGSRCRVLNYCRWYGDSSIGVRLVARSLER